MIILTAGQMVMKLVYFEEAIKMNLMSRHKIKTS